MRGRFGRPAWGPVKKAHARGAAINGRGVSRPAGLHNEPCEAQFVTTVSNKPENWYGHIRSCGRYRSRFERRIAEQLKTKGVKYWYEPIRIPYEWRGETRHYIPDFGVKTKEGKRVLLEAKGYMDERASWKMVAVKRQHPELDIRFIFQSASTKVGSKQSQRRRKLNTGPEWAGWRGFPWAVEKVPDEWIEGFMPK